MYNIYKFLKVKDEKLLNNVNIDALQILKKLQENDPNYCSKNPEIKLKSNARRSK